MANQPLLRNRIVGYSEMDPNALLMNPKNWRIHPRQQQDALLGVLQTVGVVQNIIVNVARNSYGVPGDVVVDGHLRVALALQQGWPRVPVTQVELEPWEEDLILATLDPIGAGAATDRAQLQALLQTVHATDQGITQLLADLAAREGLTAAPAPAPPDPPTPYVTITLRATPGDLARYIALMAHYTAPDEPGRVTQLLDDAEAGRADSTGT